MLELTRKNKILLKKKNRVSIFLGVEVYSNFSVSCQPPRLKHFPWYLFTIFIFYFLKLFNNETHAQ